MEFNEINIKFGTNTLTRISGNLLGREIFEKQIRGNIDENKLNVIILPSHLEGVSISFVQGLLAGLLEYVELENIYQMFSFRCDNENVERKITNSISASHRWNHVD